MTELTQIQLDQLYIHWSELGANRERERIIKLLKDTFGTLGIQLQTGSYVFATDLETLIKGEQK